MSAYLGRDFHSEYRRDDDNGKGGRDMEKERDRGRRQGEHSQSSSGLYEQTPRSPRARRQSRSPERRGSRHEMQSENSHPISPSSWDSRTPVSVEQHSPFSLPLKRAQTNIELVSNADATTPVSASIGPETRDPRLLKRIKTSSGVGDGNITSGSIAGSPNLPDPAIERASSRSNSLATSSVLQRTGQVLSLQPQNPSPLTSGAALERSTDPAARLVILLGSLFENASDSAAIKYEHGKVQAKATHQANLDKKMGDLSKTYPAFAETSAKARQDTEKDLALLDQKLSKHQKAQNDLLSTVSDVLLASRPPITTDKEREQMDMVRRCISVYEEFKSNVADLKERFEKHRLMTGKIEDDYQSLDSKVNSSAAIVGDLSSHVRSTQDQCSQLNENQQQLKSDLQTFRSETTSSLAGVRTDLRHCAEHSDQYKTEIDAAGARIDTVLQRLGLLETKFGTLSESHIQHERKAQELDEKLADDHTNKIHEIEAIALHNKSTSNAVRLIRQEIQDLRQISSDTQNQKPSPPPEIKELSVLKTDVAALRADVLELKNQKGLRQDVDQSGRKFTLKDAAGSPPHIVEDANNRMQTPVTDVDDRLKGCLENIESIQERFKQKQTEEEERDDIIVAQVEEIRAASVTAQEELRRRIENLESDLKNQRAEDLNKTQKIEDCVSRLAKAGSQNLNSRISPPSAPPTPQIHHIPRLQAISSSPQPSVPVSLVELNKRLDNAESSLLATKQQLQAVTVAYQQLDQRYNNLSTEPIVRAMVHQMQLMYPYASDAQREIFYLKQMVEPLRMIPTELESLKRIADNHNARFARTEARIDTLDMEKTKNEAKQDKLVKHVKEERGKLVDEVKVQKENVHGLGERLDLLEECRSGEPKKLAYLTETLGNKLQEEFTKTFEGLNRRLDILETDSRRQDLLDAFTGRPLANMTADHVRELEEDDMDDSSVALVVKTNQRNAKSAPLSAPSGVGKTFLKSKTALSLKKRKGYGSQEKNDRSDDDTYTPKAQSSPSRRKHRG